MVTEKESILAIKIIAIIIQVKGTMVVRGAGILTSTPQAQVREFLIFIIHEKYNIVQNDIAVARIKKSFSRKPSVPIFLANGKALENKEINVYYESCLQVGKDFFKTKDISGS